MCLLMANIHEFKAFTGGLQHSMKCLTHQMYVLEITKLLFLHTILAAQLAMQMVFVLHVQKYEEVEREDSAEGKKKALEKSYDYPCVGY